MFYEESKMITIGSILSAIINIILNVIFIKLFGYKAAAYTTLACYILLAIFHYIMMKKVCKKNGVNEDIYDIKFIILACTFLVSLSIIINLLSSYLFLRYLILLILVGLIFINKKNILKYFKEIKKKK